MSESCVKFHSATDKRRILIAEDEFVNREVLRNMLEDEYEIITAEDGKKAFELIYKNKEQLSLVLLDLQMPGMHGLDVLKRMREDPFLCMIPVIVLTGDKQAEVDCLNFGAADFISKPFPDQKVILARITRNIELSEDRQTLNATERDPLTGLYNKEFFYSYSYQYDMHHKNAVMDAIVIDINHFHMINERYGKAYGDEVLKSIGEKVREMVREDGGIVCRREADTFLIYCPHRTDYKAILDNASIGLAGNQRTLNRVRLRMGVYANADKGIEIERRFDRAKMAADTIRGNYSKAISLYDEELHKAEIYDEQLLENFHEALQQRQFAVYYQPKFGIKSKQPELKSAEALVRWKHPELGMISPGTFIPLFEKNGLIRELDRYVWEESARQVGEWHSRYGIKIPVSVNVSRIDMYDPYMIDVLADIVRERGLDFDDLLLEITESAYTQDSEQIIDTVNKLRDLGFKIEMDDFGTGYSSLNMLSSLPIDALKLDMQFIRNAFSSSKDTHIIEVIIDIAEYLGVPVIAEGVETEEQLFSLSSMGCDMVQGYYFSAPVPAGQFEKFIEGMQNTEHKEETASQAACTQDGRKDEIPFEDVKNALTDEYYSIYCVDMETGEFTEYNSGRCCKSLSGRNKDLDFFEACRKAAYDTVYPPDLQWFVSVLDRKNIAESVEKKGSFSIVYRLGATDDPVLVNLKAIPVNRKDKRMLAVGINNIGTGILQEQHVAALGKAREIANTDPLTGVKTRNALLETEKLLNQKIKEGSPLELAIAVCDINDLKLTNDTKGHKEGDRLIQEACSIICGIFSHSPVFRIGGDEFVVILKNQDYNNRQQLVMDLQDIMWKNAKNNEATVACGIADFIPGHDHTLAVVFERADAAMYKNKKFIKQSLR